MRQKSERPTARTGSGQWGIWLTPNIDMRTQVKPGFWLGLLSGFFLTLPLVAIFYLDYRLAALPFPPFNLFDWQTRVLPGSVVAKRIDIMVPVIGWLHVNDTSGAAKLAEQSIRIHPSWPDGSWTPCSA